MGEFSSPLFLSPLLSFFFSYPSNIEIIFDFSEIITKIHPHFKILDPPLPYHFIQSIKHRKRVFYCISPHYLYIKKEMKKPKPFITLRDSGHLRTLEKCRNFYISNPRRVLSQCNTRPRCLYLRPSYNGFPHSDWLYFLWHGINYGISRKDQSDQKQ